MPIKRLVLGAGIWWNKQGFETLCDIRPFDGIDVVHDLNETPWPFADNSFDSVVAIHLVEHLKDLISFMNEAHRIIKPGGSLYIETPNAGADPDLEYADPTHIRCYRPHTFINYFTLEGIDKFGYTDKCWGSLHIEAKNNILIVHTMPIK